MIDIFPAGLLDPDKLEDVIIFLQQLPVPPRTKKEALVAWTKFVGVALTHEMVRLLLGPAEERAR